MGRAARRLGDERRRRRGGRPADRVYVFNRSEHPMIVFDRDGQLPRVLGRGRLRAPARRATSAPDDAIYCTDDGDHTRAQVHPRRQGAAGARRPGPARPVHERRAVLPVHPHGAVAGGRHLRLRRLLERPRPQVLARRRATCCPGASPASTPASSTCRTTSSVTPTAGSTSPTGRTTASRSSTATAGSKPSGTTCTGPAACSRPRTAASMSAKAAPPSTSAATPRTSGRASASGAGSGTLLARLARRPPARRPASSCRRTGSRSIPEVTSTSARWLPPHGRPVP